MSCGSAENGRSYWDDYQQYKGRDWFPEFMAPVFEYEFQGCVNGNLGPNSPLVCVADADEKSQGCPCMGLSAWAIDLTRPQDGIQCHGGEGAHNVMIVTPTDWNAFVYGQHVAVMARIADLAGNDVASDAITGPELADAIWPHFYHFYNNARGKAEVDAFLKAHPHIPPAAVAALKANYTDDVQRKYGVLNAYDWPEQGWSGFHGVMVNYGYGQSRMMTLEEMKTYLLRKTVAETDFDSPKANYGNPLWNDNQRRQAFRAVIGTDVATGKDFIDEWAQSYVNQGLVTPGKSADDYFDPKARVGQKSWIPDTDKDYNGDLPYAPPFNMLPHEPVHRSTKDPTTQQWNEACSSPESTQALLPVVAGALGGGLAGMIVPGQSARVIAGITVGSAAYIEVKAIYGMNALLAWAKGESEAPKERAALILSLGVPVSIWQSAWEIGLVPERFNSVFNHYGGMIAAAGVGYVVIYPILDPILTVSSDVLTVLAAPLDVLTSIVHWFSSGCGEHELTSWTNITCKCENANNKPAMSAALVQDVYGATGKQMEMRMDCMHAATTSGAWGTEPFSMGVCNDKGWMNTPTACITAGEWAYQKWDPSLDKVAKPMWDEISHCVDPNNASMLPPLDSDSACVAKYGKYARQGGTSIIGGNPRPGSVGTCYDFRAPVGQQSLETNAYDWSTLVVGNNKGSCTIL